MRAIVAFLALLLAACQMPAVQGSRAAPYSTSARAAGMADGPSVRAAVDGNGDLSEPQELIALNVPLGPFTIKGGLVWNGQTWTVPVPGVPLAAQAADPCAPLPAPAPQAHFLTETYVEEFPVEETVMAPQTRTRIERRVRTRQVPARLVPMCEPAPPAPQAAPCDPPTGAPPSGSASDQCPCVGGCCGIP